MKVPCIMGGLTRGRIASSLTFVEHVTKAVALTISNIPQAIICVMVKSNQSPNA